MEACDCHEYLLLHILPHISFLHACSGKLCHGAKSSNILNLCLSYHIFLSWPINLYRNMLLNSTETQPSFDMTRSNICENVGKGAYFNWLWPSDRIWRHTSWSIFRHYWTKLDLSSKVLCDIHLRAVAKEVTVNLYSQIICCNIRTPTLAAGVWNESIRRASHLSYDIVITSPTRSLSLNHVLSMNSMKQKYIFTLWLLATWTLIGI